MRGDELLGVCGEQLSERHAFYEAVILDPDDVTTRLAFADWLDERGTRPSDPQRAEFIRLQCSPVKECRSHLARTSTLGVMTCICDECTRTKRESELLSGNAWSWARSALRAAYTAGKHHADVLTWCNGFVEKVTLRSDACFGHLDAILEQQPIREVCFKRRPPIIRCRQRSGEEATAYFFDEPDRVYTLSHHVVDVCAWMLQQRWPRLTFSCAE